MLRSEFHFDLPDGLIAQAPLPERGASRLLVLDGVTGAVADKVFGDLPSLLRRGDLLVFNDTRLTGRAPATAQAPSRALILKVTHLLSF